jgi:manganese transport protein
MVSIAYMDPGNYGTDIASGTAFRYQLLWALWMAAGMAMILQYLSGKIGIATGNSLADMVRKSLGPRRSLVYSYWLGAEAAAAATDLAEYLGTVIALNLLFSVPLLYAAIFGAFDVILIMTMMHRKFRLIEQFFMLLVSILVFGFLYQLLIIKPDPAQVAIHSVIPGPFVTAAILLVVGNIGATVMPHALFVHSWLTKNKMGIAGKEMTPVVNGNDSTSNLEKKRKTRRLHLWETIVFLSVAGVVNVGILLVAVPLSSNPNLTVAQVASQLGIRFGAIIPVVFALTLLSSGLTSSTLGTLAGQVIMEDLIGKHWNVWLRRIITRFVNVFPTTFAILIGLDPLALLVYSQVILSLMLPLPTIPVVYYTSKHKYMGEFVNRKITTILALLTVALILAFNVYLLITIL